jgi:hypothetical protein
MKGESHRNSVTVMALPDTAVFERRDLAKAPYLIGYARVSKGDAQSNAAQRRALDAAGCKRVFEETASGDGGTGPSCRR